MAGDVKLSVVLKAIPKTLQSHVHLRMDSSTTYEDVKSLVLSYEVSTTNWSAARVQQELGLVSANKGVVAMEVDQEGTVAQIKGGKDRSKGKGKDKGKGKTKGDKGKGKDSPNPKVKPKAKSSATSPASPADKSTAAPAPKASVKRIMFDIRSDPEGAGDSVVRGIQDASGLQVAPGKCVDPTSSFGPSAALQCSPVCLPDLFDMTLSDHDDEWDFSPASTFVRVAAVSNASCDDRKLEICVDTAADESCLPLDFGHVGERVNVERSLVDCQGQPHAHQRQQVSQA